MMMMVNMNETIEKYRSLTTYTPQTYKSQFRFSVFTPVWVTNGNKGIHHPGKTLGDPFYMPASILSEEKQKKKIIELFSCDGMTSLHNVFSLYMSFDCVWVVPILWTECGRKDLVECFRIVGPIIIDDSDEVNTRRFSRRSKARRNHPKKKKAMQYRHRYRNIIKQKIWTFDENKDIETRYDML